MPRTPRTGRVAVPERPPTLAGSAGAIFCFRARRSRRRPCHRSCPGGPPRRRRSDNDILVIFGDDIGLANISAYSHGLMGYRTPNIDRIARDGMMFIDYYAEQSCTAGRSTFITGQATLRTGLSKVGIRPPRSGCRTAMRRSRSS